MARIKVATLSIVLFVALEITFCLSAKVPSNPPVKCTFNPSEIKEMFQDEIVNVFVNCSLNSNHVSGDVVVTGVSADPGIAEIVYGKRFIYRFDQTFDWSNESFFSVQGLFLGLTRIKICVQPVNGSLLENLWSGSTNLSVDDGAKSAISEDESAVDYMVVVIRKERVIDRVFLGLVAVLLICGSVGIGCKVDLAVVKEVLMRPVAPVIGFCCQYLIMPLTAFGLVKLIGLTGGQALGLFASGCAPGGGSSNMYTYLLGGDVSLSVTLTLISILASLFMIPLWLFTLGQLYIESHSRIKIPFENIIISLVSILIPVVIGIVIQKKWAKGAKFIVRCIRPVYILLILCMFTIGVYSNLYIFRLITPTLVLAGCLLPYIGFFLGGLVAFILRQPLPRVLTIAIETGVQNTGMPIMLMKFSLPQPEADLSIVSPVIVAMFMPLPLWIAVAVVEIRRRCCRRRGDVSLEQAHVSDIIVEASGENRGGEKLTAANNNVDIHAALLKGVKNEDVESKSKEMDDVTAESEQL